jgi:deoxyadenosine/deoxycytidine kinase
MMIGVGGQIGFHISSLSVMWSRRFSCASAFIASEQDPLMQQHFDKFENCSAPSR